MRGHGTVKSTLQKGANRILRGICGDPDYLESRYRCLYGTRQEEKARQDIQKNKKRLTTALIAVTMLILVTGITAGRQHQHFLYEEEGEKTLVGILRPDQGVLREDLTAAVQQEGREMKAQISIRIPAAGQGKDHEGTGRKGQAAGDGEAAQRLRRELDIRLRDAAEGEGKVLMLPLYTEEGEFVRWSQSSRRDPVYLLTGTLFIAVLLYRARYVSLNGEFRSARSTVQKELPLFINQLVLQLNAGAIFETAFLDILRNEMKKKETSYFYRQLEMIRLRYLETKDPLDAQLAAFARRIDDADFIRIAGIIRDNLHRGIRLSEKLLTERNDLMHRHRKKLEEEIRVKETRLTMPLCLYLLVLIAVAIAPAILSS